MKLKWVWQKVKKLNLKWWNRDGKGKPKSTPEIEVENTSNLSIQGNIATIGNTTIDLSKRGYETEMVIGDNKPTVSLSNTLENVTVVPEGISQGMTVPVVDMIPAGTKKGETTIIATSEKVELLEMRRRLEECLAQLDKVLASKK